MKKVILSFAVVAFLFGGIVIANEANLQSTDNVALEMLQDVKKKPTAKKKEDCKGEKKSAAKKEDCKGNDIINKKECCKGDKSSTSSKDKPEKK